MSADERVGYLNRVLSATVNSLIQYIDVATPYVPPGSEQHLETIARLKREEAGQASRLVAVIERIDGVPAVGIFPFWNVDLNYLDLRFLVGFAARRQGEILEGLRAGLDRLRGDRDAYAEVSAVLEEKRLHLTVLRTIAGLDEPAPPVEAGE
ncbi:MAG: hypothetical protein ACE5JG_08930 [Planctomycetota bacterium]